VLMGHLPKEIVYRSRPALRRHILESFLDSPSIRYGRGTKGDARLSLASENADLFGAGLERRPWWQEIETSLGDRAGPVSGGPAGLPSSWQESLPAGSERS